MNANPNKGLGLALNNSQAAHEYFMRWFPYWGRERFIAVGVDDHFRVVSAQQTLGGFNGVHALSDDDVFGDAIAAGAKSIIICHNHPGPAVEPSENDSKTTERLRKLGERLGVRLWDHLIIHKGLLYSFRIDGSLGSADPVRPDKLPDGMRCALKWQRRKWRWQRQLLGEWKLVW